MNKCVGIVFQNKNKNRMSKEEEKTLVRHRTFGGGEMDDLVMNIMFNY